MKKCWMKKYLMKINLMRMFDENYLIKMFDENDFDENV